MTAHKQDATIRHVESALQDVAPGLEAIRAERRRILSSLLAMLDQLAERGAAAIRDEITAYAHADERLRSDMKEQVALNYRTKLCALLDERSATLEDLTFVRKAAMRRARAGFALEDYINAFRVGQQVFWDALLEHAGGSPVGHEAALSLASPVMRYVDLVSTHAAHAYADFQKFALADAHREHRDLLEHLLAGEMPGPGPLVMAAQAYGIGTDVAMMVATATAANGGSDADALHAATTAIARYGPAESKTLVVVRQAELVIVHAMSADTDPVDVCERLEGAQRRLAAEGVPLALGISTPAEGVAQLPRAYLEARTALECISGSTGVAALPRLSPFEYLALRAGETACRLVDPQIRAFLREDRLRGGVLTDTLRAFADADLNVRILAERLHIHPNTAHYRLARIEERANRCPRHIADLLELLFAIALETGVSVPANGSAHPTSS